MESDMLQAKRPLDACLPLSFSRGDRHGRRWPFKPQGNENLERKVAFKLLNEHIDGALLVDIARRELLLVSPDLTGRLRG